MYKSYMVHHEQTGSVPSADYQWEKEISEIKSINPDSILCHSLSEFEPLFIYGNFFRNIYQYLVDNNKVVKVLVAHFPDNVEIYPRVYTEATHGSYINNYHLVLSIIETKSDTFIADKLFTSYNNNPKIERAYLLDELARRSLFQHGIVTFLSPDRIHRHPVTGEKFPGWKYHDGSKLTDEEDFLLNTKPEYSAFTLPRSFNRGFIDIVSESHCVENEFFMTEKTTKSIGCLKPFLALSSPNYHKFLVEEFGILLYDEIFDYTFDSSLDIHERINGIVDNIDRLVQEGYSTQRFHEIREMLLPKLIHNRNVYLEYRTRKDKMILRSFEFLFTESEYKLYGYDGAWEQYVSHYRINGWTDKT